MKIILSLLVFVVVMLSIFSVILLLNLNTIKQEKQNIIYQLSIKEKENITGCPEKVDTCKMYNVKAINGVFSPNEEYYCVWTKGRNSTEIANTEQHELCHALIKADTKNHFCKTKWY